MTTPAPTFTNILVPLDGTPLSNAVLPLARTLARAANASVTLVRVVSGEDRTANRDAASQLQGIAGELAGSGLQVDSVVRNGRVADEILAAARARTSALVVMRTHARVGIERAILGSVTDQVLAECPVPVVLMRPGERRVTAIRSLVVPVDESPGSAHALDAATTLARMTGATINVVQVAVPLALQAGLASEYGIGYYAPDSDEETLASAQGYVVSLATRLRDAGLSADGEALQASSAAEGIVSAADQYAADLVVMSTRALTGPARTLLGSVANSVVRTAHCPVVLVRMSSAVL
jgi:nucleotide-binding universal stress UspA family protein